MDTTTVTFLGTGDAFGSGGRLQACIHVRRGDDQILIDCGATCSIAMQRFGIEPNAISTILLSHLHGDHFGGLPFLLLDAQFSRARTAPLLLAGPAGTRRRLSALLEAMYPGSSLHPWRFPFQILELAAGQRVQTGPVQLTPHAVAHGAEEAFALRVEVGPTVVAYSGDTAWTPALVPVARGADLFISEAFSPSPRPGEHLDIESLAEHLEELAPRRLILTHPGPETVAGLIDVPFECAHDGMVVRL